MSELKRLNKYISETGFCSRRDADRLIEQGQVKVNGLQPEMGVKVSDNDKIEINGQPLKTKPKPVYLAYNKPVGITSTTDSSDPTNIVKAIGYHERIFPIGRLDKPSQGLILLTNQGDIVNKILRAGNNHEKEYKVTVNKPITDEFIYKMANGLPILDTITKRCKVTKISARTFTIVLTQGLNRQIRRMCEYLDYDVTRLQRLRIMNIETGDLKPGEWRHLTEQEIKKIESAIKSSSNNQIHSLDSHKKGKRQTKHESVSRAAKKRAQQKARFRNNQN
ncbi:23S rRNA pseudouridine(2604) synthase RluF [Saccharobesus litoralis]|uniref:Pseudouridine synthase n=1 Tax=Saccharobesus litoralis TaxID=2172099 RepID=A0A2S0VQD3_9ALTE|nr:23S rRNA pseudouridine(2604) synthase RluF [Saccharobesus litoralis]AWB66409.1 23S rRNA pseudouridine(2604) synthase RluF [Saccharobesus litoralis]